MNWDRFFLYLGRANAALIFVAALCLGFYLVWGMVRYNDFENDSRNAYGEAATVDSTVYEGEEINVTNGTVVKYRVEPDSDFEAAIDGANVSLTHMRSGQSRLVLPNQSAQKVLRFEVIGKNGEGDEPAEAYMVLSGTPKDYEQGFLDLIIGRLADLQQRTVAKRLRFVDSPRLIDPQTLSLIVWQTDTMAEFWIIDLETFAIATKRKIDLPMPSDRDVSAASDSASSIVDHASGMSPQNAF